MNKVVTVRINKEIQKGITELSELANVPVSKVIRTILNDYIALYRMNKKNENKAG